MEFNTKRLVLKPVSSKWSEEIFHYRSDAETNQYQGWIPKTIDDVRDFIGKLPTEINIPGTWFQFVLFENENNQLIGDVGIHFIDNDQVEIGCTLDKNFHGKGFANEALSAVIDHLFKGLGKHRIRASVDPDNEGSIKMMQKLGFRKEAHFIESYNHNGKWVDDVVFALLAREWKN